jgi:hypothetical protein
MSTLKGRANKHIGDSGFFSQFCDVKILVNFAPKFAKLVEITLGKRIYLKFPRIFS